MTDLTIANVQPQITALLATLDTIDDTVPVGNHEAPAARPPYLMLTVYLDVEDGTVGQPWERMDLSFQVSCVAADPLEAAWLRDRVVAELLTVPLEIAQRSVVQVRPNGGQGPTRDPEQPPGEPALFTASPRFILTTA